MADSNITKRALAAALTELMEEMPFSKISVGDICGRCDMNRKSFYYHFKDKYDLVNWIFDIGFISAITSEAPQDDLSAWNFCKKLFCYLYDNRSFYRKALEITGQNAFSEHFHDMLFMVFSQRIQPLGEIYSSEFCTNFFADALVCSIKRWITDKSCMPPEDFTENLKSCIMLFSKATDFKDE